MCVCVCVCVCVFFNLLHIACEQGVKYGRQCNKLCENRHCLIANSPCTTHGYCSRQECQAGWSGPDCSIGIYDINLL